MFLPVPKRHWKLLVLSSLNKHFEGAEESVRSEECPKLWLSSSKSFCYWPLSFTSTCTWKTLNILINIDFSLKSISKRNHGLLKYFVPFLYAYRQFEGSRLLGVPSVDRSLPRPTLSLPEQKDTKLLNII